MSQRASSPPAVKAPASPGRPKDMNKRAAILHAAEALFVEHGYEGTSMDQIAADAGVSKLTVYSHFGDKEALFAEAVQSYCEKQLPTSAFDPSPGTPLRERLLTVGRAYFAMISAPQAISGHRLLCSTQLVDRRLAALFWNSGPQRVHDKLTALLSRRIAAGELAIDDPPRAAAHFFSLLRGELHQQMVFGVCSHETCDQEREAHIASVVDMFLRAYGTRP